MTVRPRSRGDADWLQRERCRLRALAVPSASMPTADPHAMSLVSSLTLPSHHDESAGGEGGEGRGKGKTCTSRQPSSPPLRGGYMSPRPLSSGISFIPGANGSHCESSITRTSHYPFRSAALISVGHDTLLLLGVRNRCGLLFMLT